MGFSVVGYNILGCVDIDPFSCKTIELNGYKKRILRRPKTIQADIHTLTGQQILTACEAEDTPINMIIGGPPCQAFSVFGKRGGLKDARGNLLWEYVRLIRELRPDAFMLENVPGLRTIHNGELFSQLTDALSLDGQYVVSVQIYEMAHFGIPQFRERIFFIGNRKSVDVPLMKETHGPPGLFAAQRPFLTVHNALTGLPEPTELCSVPNHTGRKHSERIKRRYRLLRYGERDPVTRINKLHPGRPSFTIIVGSDAGGGKGHVHPYAAREVTPRESARIQTFPDWWEFSGNGRHVIRQVGNAVPPLFAAMLGQHIAKHVFGRKRMRSFEELIEKLGLDYLQDGQET